MAEIDKEDASKKYEAIVIGSGISGGWAAKELCEKGLKTLVLERGRDVRHIADYPTATMDPWDFKYRGRLTAEAEKANPIASRCYAFDDATAHFFVKDDEHPYIQEKPFDWIRGYQVGGKSLIWARQTQRWSRYEFLNPHRDQYSIKWPISYEDLAPWYSHVESFVGISGEKNGLDTLPDGEFLQAWEMNQVESEIAKSINDRYQDRHAIIGRCAHLTAPTQVHLNQGRGQCQARNLCYRGCPYGGYFSSNSSTLPWAEKTGHLTLKSDSVVHSIIYVDQSKKAIGVRVIHRITKSETEYLADIIFVNAGSINSNLILMNSVSKRFPNGLANDHDILGRYIGFHNYRGSVTAMRYDHMDSYYSGRRPTSIMIPNFRNVKKNDVPFKGGYMSFYTASRQGWTRQVEGKQYGAEYKEALSEPGPWSIYMMMQGETIPKSENHIRLSTDKKDDWGIPQLVTSVGYDDNDELMLRDFHEQASEMLTLSGCEDIVSHDSGQSPGLDIHVIGGARMGVDPQTSMTDRWCRLHLCQNVYVTDGACLSSTGVQNPSLTYMAMTARAVDRAVKDWIKK